MTSIPVNKYFVLNGDIKSVREFDSSKNEGGIYEVLRVIDSIPLFLEDHLERFFHSAELSGKTIGYSVKEIKQFLDLLINRNKVLEGNILLSFKINLEAFFIKHSYPNEILYEEGVVCGILKAERSNPNAKVLHTAVRHRADQMLQEKKFFEVLLLDHLGKVTEGSRSNVFFVSGNKLVTSPAGKVLLGITRQKTIQLATMLKIDIEEREINFNQLKVFDAAFLTGTSPKILPVSKIDAFRFDPKNELVLLLIESYNKLIDSYIKENKEKEG